MIIGSNQKKICFVDCFAGPWQEGSADLSDTSIAISLQIMKKCKNGLRRLGHNVEFQALYIEKDEIAFGKLEEFLREAGDTEVKTKALKGDFLELRQSILEFCGKDIFVFFFIDDKGWKNITIPALKPLLQRLNSEYLINFMFDFIVRTSGMKEFQDHMRELFGEVPCTTGLDPKQKEKYLLSLYRKYLKEERNKIGERTRTAYVRVLDPLKERTKYHLVYLTGHQKGIEVFMQESEKLNFIQKRVRAEVQQNSRIIKSGQTELFSVEDDMKEKEDGIDLSMVKDYWLKKLTFEPKKFDIASLADMLEETDWFIGDLQAAFKELQNEGIVKNFDSIKTRPKHAINFAKKERLARVK